MKQILKNVIKDESDAESFVFSLSCSECGKSWKSMPVRFSKAGIEPQNAAKQTIYQALYQRERELAREQAVTGAVHHFNRCPLCGWLICNDCFLICEDLDMCRSCAEKLQETGEPASFAGWAKG